MSIKTKPDKRLKRRRRVRAKISGTAQRPRISIFRSNKGISAQLVDDLAGHTIAAVSWTEAPLRDKAPMEQATEGGKLLAERAKKAGIEHAVSAKEDSPYERTSRRSIRQSGRPGSAGARRRDQPRGQGRQGRPSLLVHGARGRR